MKEPVPGFAVFCLGLESSQSHTLGFFLFSRFKSIPPEKLRQLKDVGTRREDGDHRARWGSASPCEAQVQFAFPALSLLNLNGGVAAIPSTSLLKETPVGSPARRAPLWSGACAVLSPERQGSGSAARLGRGFGWERGLSCPAPHMGGNGQICVGFPHLAFPLEELRLEKPGPCKGKFPGTILSAHQPFFFFFN